MSSAKERSRVRVFGKMDTRRKIAGFGSWKHNVYSSEENARFCGAAFKPVVRPLARRLIGDNNRGKALSFMEDKRGLDSATGCRRLRLHGKRLVREAEQEAIEAAAEDAKELAALEQEWIEAEQMFMTEMRSSFSTY